MARLMRVASSTSSSVVTPKLVPRAACVAMACVTCGIGVAEKKRAPGADEIEVAVAVGVVEVLGFAAIDDERVGLDVSGRRGRES